MATEGENTFFILSAILVIITLHGTESPYDVKHIPLISRIANAPVAFVTYLVKTFWPHDMAIFYPFPDQILLWQVLGASLLILVITAAVIVMVKRLPYLFVGWLWYAITLLPVIKIVQVGNDAMADRYHYLPSIGIAVMLAWGIPSLFKNENTRKKILFPAATAFMIILSFLTWQQCSYWKNSTTLFSHALQVTKDNYLAHANLALALAEKENFNEAIDHFSEAIRIDSFNEIHYRINRGRAYTRLENHQLAIDDFNKVISLNPNYVEPYYYRGISYGKRG